MLNEIKKLSGPTETRTRIAGFRVRSANHYTIGPCVPRNEIFKNKISFEKLPSDGKIIHPKISRYIPNSNVLY